MAQRHHPTLATPPDAPIVPQIESRSKYVLIKGRGIEDAPFCSAGSRGRQESKARKVGLRQLCSTPLLAAASLDVEAAAVWSRLISKGW